MVELLVMIVTVLFADITVTGLLTGVLYRRYQLTKIKAVLLAVLFFSLDLVLAVVELIFVASNPDNLTMIYLDIDQPFPIIFSALGILGAGTFLLFINYYLREEISLTHVAVIFSILFTFLTWSFVKLYLNFHGVTYPNPSVPNTPISFEFLPAVLITYLLIVTYPQLIRLARTTDLARQRYVVIAMLIALTFYYVNTAVLITVSNQLQIEGDNYIIFSSILPRISVIIGDIIMFATYARIPAGYLHDQRIEKLLIISKSGILVYSQDFIDSQGQTDGDMLLSGGLSAISSMLTETIGVSKLESIEFKEKEVLIDHYPAVGFFLITNRPSRFLWNALASVSTIFEEVTRLDNAALIREEIPREQQLAQQVSEIFGV